MNGLQQEPESKKDEFLKRYGTSMMAIKAVKEILKKTQLDPKQVDMVIVATITPDIRIALPVATEIGATNAFG